MEVNGTDEPVQSADRYTSTTINQDLSCTGGSKIYEWTCSVCREAKPTKANAKPRNQPETDNTKKHYTNQTNQKTGHASKTTKPTEKREPQAPTRTTNNEAGRQDKAKQGRRGKKASGSQQTRRERTPGKAAEAGGRMPHKQSYYSGFRRSSCATSC